MKVPVIPWNNRTHCIIISKEKTYKNLWDLEVLSSVAKGDVNQLEFIILINQEKE